VTAFGTGESPRRDLDLLVLGDINPDLVLAGADVEAVFGQAERLVDEASLTIGGSGAIMACAGARLGLRTAIAGVVGDDLFGGFMLDALHDRGVDTSGVIVDASRQTGLTVVLARPGDRAMLTFAGAITAMRGEQVDTGLLARARHIHISSFFLQTALTQGLTAPLESARAGGATMSVDPNWDPSGGWDAGLRHLLPHIDVLLPNAVEACRIARRDDPRIAAAELAAAGPLVAVKLGAAGALASLADGQVVSVAAPTGIAPVDAVGAGDSFDAGRP
jgi:sugar/nucleoside kinase (ribokinase family)